MYCHPLYSDGPLSDTHVVKLFEKVKELFRFISFLTTSYKDILFNVKKTHYYVPKRSIVIIQGNPWQSGKN